MAQFTHSLCEEVIRTEGGCGLSRNEITQMARLALRALKDENPWKADALRYHYLRSEKLGEMLAMFPTTDTSDVGLDHAIFAAMSGTGPAATQRADAASSEGGKK